MLQLPIEEYFRYHPPETEERKAKHERVNQEALAIAVELISLKGDNRQNQSVWGVQIARAIALTSEVCKDETCKVWARRAIRDLDNDAENSQDVVMYVQQLRMFLNQGITIDELVAKREKAVDATD